MEQHMKRCLELAVRSNYKEKTNPKVGAVIVKDGKVLSEGYHEYYGGPHAEVNAIENATVDITGSTIYCNLEPCFHTGKQPPCVDRIIKEGITKVVIANQDPNPLVAGKSIQNLRNHGIEVIEGILEDEAKDLNKDFFKYITKKKPYVTLKIAMSLDGKVALKNGESKWITSEASRAHGRSLRSQNSAMIVTDKTISIDNPCLTSRDGTNRNPDVFILGDNFESNKPLNLYRQDRNVYVITNKQHKSTTLYTPISIRQTNGLLDLNEVLEKIAEQGHKRVLIESGGTLNFSALQSGVVDEVHIYIAPKILGGSESISSVMGDGVSSIKEALNIDIQSIEKIDKDILIKGVVKCSQESSRKSEK